MCCMVETSIKLHLTADLKAINEFLIHFDNYYVCICLSFENVY